jgi:low temperature requirement protein LtrA
MAERCGLFVIIALGESLLVTGATFAQLPWSLEGLGAFLVAVVGSIAHILIRGASVTCNF